MKKEYKAPHLNIIELESESILAQSPDGNIAIDKNGEGGSEQLSNKNRGEWGNIWGK